MQHFVGPTGPLGEECCFSTSLSGTSAHSSYVGLGIEVLAVDAGAVPGALVAPPVTSLLETCRSVGSHDSRWYLFFSSIGRSSKAWTRSFLSSFHLEVILFVVISHPFASFR